MDGVIVVSAEHFIAKAFSISKDSFVLCLERADHILVIIKAFKNTGLQSFRKFSILSWADAFQGKLDLIDNLFIIHFHKVNSHILDGFSGHAIFTVNEL